MRTSSRSLFALLLSLSVATACSDADDTTTSQNNPGGASGTNAGSSGTSGHSGSSGTSGGAGAAGVAGASGSNGSAGTAGSAGTGGAAGTGGSGANGGTSGVSGSTTGGTGGTAAQAIASVSISSDDFCVDCGEIQVGSSRQFHAHAYDADNNEITTVSAATWTVDDATLASVDPTGLVTPIQPGQTLLNATIDGVTGTIQLTVDPAHVARVEITPASVTLAALADTQVFTAIAYDDADQPMSNVHLDWSTGNGAIATISASSPFVSTATATAVSTGMTSVQVMANGWTIGSASLTVIKPIPDTAPFTLASIAGGASHTCAIDTASKGWCWGSNYFGQLGDNGLLPSTDNEPAPVAVHGGHSFVSITAGLAHSCAIDAQSKAWCWGDPTGGELGNGLGETQPVVVPEAVAGNHLFSKVSAGGSVTCGITTDQHLFCWGQSPDGAVGNGATDAVTTPAAIAPDQTWIDVATGLWSTCAVRADGKAFCWGADDLGQLGNDDAIEGSVTPLQVAGGHTFTSLSMYRATTCGVTAQGEVLCWGANDTDQIGESQTGNVPTPVALTGAAPAVSVVAGSFHVCIVTTAGKTFCRGNDDYGQLGNGMLTQSSTWTEVIGGLSFAHLSTGSHHVCALTQTGGAYCWGANDFGVLGSGGTSGVDSALSLVPWPVAIPASAP